VESSEEGTQAIVSHWLARWFAPRARREESLARVRQSVPDDIRLSREIHSDQTQRTR